MLTRAQFGAIVRADEKWVENACRSLSVRLSYSILEARWLGLVRLFARELRVPLVSAAAMANRAIAEPVGTRDARVAETSGGVSVVVDLARYHSDFAGAVATALHNGQPKASGRPPQPKRRAGAEILRAASARGVDLTLLKGGLQRTPAERLRRLDENTAFIRAIRPVGHPGARSRPLVPLLDAIPRSTHVGGPADQSCAGPRDSRAESGGDPR